MVQQNMKKRKDIKIKLVKLYHAKLRLILSRSESREIANYRQQTYHFDVGLLHFWTSTKFPKH